ncbi:MAG: twin-arginine translocase subunit TatC [Candidatus Eisenbacteria bacterium]
MSPTFDKPGDGSDPVLPPAPPNTGDLAMTPRRDQAFDDSASEPGDPDAPREMTFLDHLEELRWVLFHSIIACLAGAIGGWLLAPRVLEDIIARTVKHAVVLSPLEAFNERLKLALFIGLFIALPVVFYRIWAFVVPGLLKRERSWVLPMAMASMALFALGAWAAYSYVVPMVIDVLSGFMTPSMVAQIRLGALLGFVYNMALACGVVCQMPLVTMTLTAIGLVTPGFLLRQWRIAIVGAFFLTAIITPGDVVTAQLVMGVPMTLLYFISVGMSWIVARRRAAAAAEEHHAPQS